MPQTLLVIDDAKASARILIEILEARGYDVRHTLSEEAALAAVEAYPVEPKNAPMPPVFAYTGIASAYVKAGFREVARRSVTRPIMRHETV